MRVLLGATLELEDRRVEDPPSWISIARLIVSSGAQASGPAITVPRNGSSASLISQLAEFHRYDGLWSTA